MVILLGARRRQRAISQADFYSELLDGLDRPGPDERVPHSAEREAMRRRTAYAEVDVIVETVAARLARAEALASDVEHPAARAIRRARRALEAAQRLSC